MDDTIVFNRPMVKNAWSDCPVVHITDEAMAALKEISAETGLAVSYIASELIKYGKKHTIIE